MRRTPQRKGYRMHVSRLTGRGLLLLLLAACSENEAVPAVVVSDSAGVRIVQSNYAQWSDADAWRIGAEPILAFGHDESLYQLRGASRLPDGRIVVGHGSVPEVLVFSAEGILLERIGRRGSGPGEYLEFSRFRSGTGDSIMIYDYSNQRVSILDREGRYHRSVSTPSLPTGTLASPEDHFSDGSILATPFGGPPSGNGLTRRERELWRVSTDGASATPIVSFPELEQFFFENGAGLPLRQPFFGKNAYYIAGTDRLFWAATETFEIRTHSPDGTLLAIFRKAHPERTFNRSDVEGLIEDAIAGISDPDVQRGRRAALGELPMAGTVPALGWPDYGPSYGPAMQLDRLGNFWIAEYYLPGAVRNARTILSAEGAWLGTVELPLNFTPHDIGAGYVLGVWRDDLGVEELRLYELLKPSAPN